MLTESNVAPFVSQNAIRFTGETPLAVMPQAAANALGAPAQSAANQAQSQAEPQCNSRSEAESLNDKLRQIEEAEDRLNQKMEQLQRCLEKAHLGRHDAGPPLGSPAIYPAQPIRQPVPPPDAGVRGNGGPIYAAQPATYVSPQGWHGITEPSPLIIDPRAAAPIQEPRQPVARIVGARAIR